MIHNRYKATINGHTFKQEFRFHELRALKGTFKNVTWKSVGEGVNK